MGLIEVETIKPYPATMMTSKDWAAIPLEVVELDCLIATQEYLSISVLFDLDHRRGLDRFPWLVEWEEELYIENGHHRIVRALLIGKCKGRARVLRGMVGPDHALRWRRASGGHALTE